MGVDYEDILEDKQAKYHRQYLDGQISQWDVLDRARQSADRAHAAGDYAKNTPAQQPQVNTFPQAAGRDSIDDDDDQLLQQPRTQNALPDVDEKGFYVYNDNLDDMFAAVGGLGDKDDAPDDAPKAQAQEKLGWGSRLWNGLKGIGGLLKNVTGYNMIRHGLFGANFRRGKVKKNQARLQDIQRAQAEEWSNIALGKPALSEEQAVALSRRENEVQRKLFKNRTKLGEHRRYYAGKEWKNEWSRLFTGRDAKIKEEDRKFFLGDVPATAAATTDEDDSSPASVGVGSPPPQQQAVPQSKPSPKQIVPMQKPAPPPPVATAPQNDEWDVVKAQQQYGGNDDLQLDAYGNPIYDNDDDDDDDQIPHGAGAFHGQMMAGLGNQTDDF